MSETTIPLGQLHRNDYNPRFARERHGHNVEVDIESLADSIEDTELASALLVREDSNAGYEVVAGERRLLALRDRYDDDHEVDVTIKDLTREEAIRIAREENNEREDLSPMDEAWSFAEHVMVNVDGEPLSYAEYISKLGGHVYPDSLQLPSPRTIERQGVSSDRISSDTISERLSYLLLPAEAQEWIDNGDLTKRAAREIISRCRSNIDDPEDALDMMADLAETYGPNYGGMSNDDYTDLKNDIETRVEDYERRKEIAEEEVEGFRDLVFERVETLAEDIEEAAEQFDVSSVPPIPDDPASPQDINIEEVKAGVEEYRDDLETRRSDLTNRIGVFEAEADRFQAETSRLKQAVKHYDEHDGDCPYCHQALEPDRLRTIIRDNTEKIDALRSDVHRYDDDLGALSSARQTLYRDVQRIEGALESYEEAYEKAMEFDSEVVE